MGDLSPFRRLMLVVNGNKPEAVDLGRRLEPVIRGMGLEVGSTTAYPVPEHVLADCDVCAVIGGDGTLLSVVPAALAADVPIVGINAGKLGFLTTLSPAEALEGLPAILRGRFSVEARSVLACASQRGFEGHALNDAVIKSKDGRRLIQLAVRCGSEVITRFSADGLVFSTPTGSTAYNLSAGGPIVAPTAEVITMTPICAHTLTNRSLVFPGNIELTVESLSAQHPLQVTLDGAERFDNAGGLCLRISRGQRQLRLLQPEGYHYYSVLRSKMGWRGSELHRGTSET